MSSSNKKIKYEDRMSEQDSVDAVDYALIFKDLKKKYSVSKKPIEINFRDLVNLGSGVDRYTHLIHTYPAKLLLSIPYFFINCSSLIEKNGTILDPFCGSGTVLLESIIAGKNSIGADANPLARLITKVKTTPLDSQKVSLTFLEILCIAKKTRTVLAPQAILEWDYWYSLKVSRQLGRIAHAIQQIHEKEYRNFFEVCFSTCARKVSLADPLISVPVRLNPNRYKGNKRKIIQENIRNIEKINVVNCFSQITQSNIERLSSLSQQETIGKVKSILDDAKNLESVKTNSIDLIITSPPYAGAQKYIRSSSLNIGWLGLSPDSTLRSLEKKNIGREHYSKQEYTTLLKSPVKSSQPLLTKIYNVNPLRAHIASNYLHEMEAALKECHRTLKKGSPLVLIVGNNVVCGHNFETQKFLKEICESIGFEVELILRDDIHSRGLMTKRNKTASIITCEWILVFRK